MVVQPPTVMTRVQGWLAVRVYHEARRHHIRDAVQTHRQGTHIRVRSQMIITDHQVTYSTKTQSLIGCESQPLTKISEHATVQRFLNV